MVAARLQVSGTGRRQSGSPGACLLIVVLAISRIRRTTSGATSPMARCGPAANNANALIEPSRSPAAMAEAQLLSTCAGRRTSACSPRCGRRPDIASKVREAGMERTAMILVGHVLAAADFADSTLYGKE